MSKRNKHTSRRLPREVKHAPPHGTAHPAEALIEKKPDIPEAPAPREIIAGWRRVGLAAVMIAIIAAGVGLYRHTLHFDIVLDDRSYVMENPFLKSASSFLYPLDFARFATSAARRGVDPDIAVNFITRPVTYATFYWNRLFGGTNPAGYRVVNIAIHIANGFLIFALTWMLSRDPGGHARRRRLLVPSFAALLFVAHPLATESVTYVTQRFESLATMFYLGGLCAFFAAQTVTRPFLAWLLRTTSLFCIAAGMLSKETGFTAPVMLLLSGILCTAMPWRQLLKLAAPLLFLLPLVPLLVMAAAWAQNGMDFSVWSSLNITNVGPDWIPPHHYFFTQVCASLTYLRLILLPIGQNFDPDYPLVRSMGDASFVLSAITIAALLASAWLCHRRWARPYGSLVLTGVLWFFITLAPSSSIIPLPDLFAEHRSYLPSVGIFLALAALAGRASECLEGKRGIVWLRATAAVWIAALSAATLARNEVLRDDETIYRDALAKSPRKARVWNGLGCSLAWSGRLDESLNCFKKAGELQPSLSNAWKNLSSIHLMLGHFEKALKATDEGLLHDPMSPNLRLNRGVALAALGKLQEAEKSLKAALDVSPKFREAHLCLARLYAGSGAHAPALTHLRTAAGSAPLPPTDAQLLHKLESVIASDKSALATGM